MIAKYVSSMIHQQTASYPSESHEVVFLRIEHQNEDTIFDDTVEAVMDNNPDNPTYIHVSLAKIDPYRVHESAYIVITTDVTNLVIMGH